MGTRLPLVLTVRGVASPSGSPDPQAQSSPQGPSTAGSRQPGGCRPQLAGEGTEFGHLALTVGDLGRDQLMEQPLGGIALVAVPDADEVGDLLERAAESLGGGDEPQSRQGTIVIEPVTSLGPHRRLDQADALVVAESRRAEPAALGHLADRVRAHTLTINIRPGLKVKLQ